MNPDRRTRMILVTGPSEGADRMVVRARAENKHVHTGLDDVQAGR